MPVAYKTIEVTEGPITVPAWNYTWPGSGGCASRYVFDTQSVTGNPPTAQDAYYEPFVVKENIQPSTPISGYRGKGVYPPYNFTPYGASRIVERRYLLKRQYASNQGLNVFHQYGTVPKVGATCTPTTSMVESTGPIVTRWRTVTHQFTGTEYVTNGFDLDEVNDAVLTVQDELAVSALTQYDVLTDLAEARELPGLVRDVSQDLSTIIGTLAGRYSWPTLKAGARISPIMLLKHPYKMLRKLGEEWMRYRYAIMPLCYSYRDITKLVKRGKDVTTRKVKTIEPHDLGVTLPADTTNYLWTQYDGYIRVAAVSFQHFDWESDAQLAGLGFNPLVTAWELIPYSFVFDWFVNMGNYITRKTSSSVARLMWACVSRRDSYSKRTYAHFKSENQTITFPNRLCTPWNPPSPPTTPSETLTRPAESQLFIEEQVDTYSRNLFKVGDAQLRFNPSLNWRRAIDAAVMTLNRLGGLNRRLKG